MFLALRELTFARGRFTLMGIVIALISVLVVLLSGLSSGLVNDGVSGLKSMPATAFAFNAGTITDNAFSRSLVVEAHAVAGGRVVTAAIDRADLVGYGTVAFLSQCGDGEATLLGGYVPEDGGMLLLFTTEAGSAAGDVPPVAP